MSWILYASIIFNISFRTMLDSLKIALSHFWLFERLMFVLNIPTFKPKETQYFYDLVVNTLQTRKLTGKRLIFFFAF